MRRIDFETHFVTEDYVRAMEENTGYPRYVVDKQTGNRRLYYTDDVGEPLGDLLLSKLLDTGEKRLKDMDAAGINEGFSHVIRRRSVPQSVRAAS